MGAGLSPGSSILMQLSAMARAGNAVQDGPNAWALASLCETQEGSCHWGVDQQMEDFLSLSLCPSHPLSPSLPPPHSLSLSAPTSLYVCQRNKITLYKQ